MQIQIKTHTYTEEHKYIHIGTDTQIYEHTHTHTQVHACVKKRKTLHTKHTYNIAHAQKIHTKKTHMHKPRHTQTYCNVGYIKDILRKMSRLTFQQNSGLWRARGGLFWGGGLRDRQV